MNARHSLRSPTPETRTEPAAPQDLVGPRTTAVVLVSYGHGPDLVRPALSAWSAQRHPPARIVVVDNAQEEWPSDVRTRAELLAPARNLGFGGALNLAASWASGLAQRGTPLTHLVLANLDLVLLDDDILSALHRALEQHPGALGVCPGIVFWPGTGRCWYEGGRLLRPSWLTTHDRFGTAPLTDGEVAPTGFLTGACALLDLESFFEVGQMRDDLVAYYEDVELSERAWRRGRGSFVLRRSLVAHEKPWPPRLRPVEARLSARNAAVLRATEPGPRRVLGAAVALGALPVSIWRSKEDRLAPLRGLLDAHATLHRSAVGSAAPAQEPTGPPPPPSGMRPSPPAGMQPSPSSGMRPSPPVGMQPSPPPGMRPSPPSPTRPCACGGRVASSLDTLDETVWRCGVTVFTAVYQRNIEPSCEPDSYRERIDSTGHRFAARFLLVNNVADRERARSIADRLLGAGVIDAWHFVAGHLPAALDALGLSPRDLDNAARPHLTWGIVAPFLASTQYLCHLDAEVEVHAGYDWVARAVGILENEPQVFSVAPQDDHWRPSHELVVREEETALYSYGFSDRMFLARSAELRSRIYQWPRVLPSYRYPLSHRGRIFEERVDAYLRRTGRTRVVLTDCSFHHEANTWYWPTSAAEVLPFLAARCRSRLSKLLPRSLGPRWRA